MSDIRMSPQSQVFCDSMPGSLQAWRRREVPSRLLKLMLCKHETVLAFEAIELFPSFEDIY
jgi:hypothetical protein